MQTGALVWILVSSVKCTLTIDADQKQCASTADCRNRGSVFNGSICQNSVCVPDPDWACLDENTTAAVTGNTFTVRLPVVDVVQQKPAPGIIAKLYSKIDMDVTEAIGDPVVSDANGILTFSVSAKFDGFATLESDATSTNPIVPSFYFFNPPVDHDGTVAPVRLATPASSSALLVGVGKVFDATRGIVILTAENCRAMPAEGVSYTSTPSDNQTTAFYSLDGLPTVDTHATDSSGYGGLIGVAPGMVAITGTQQSQGTIGQFSIFAKASRISYTRMVPSAQR
jgi:hypothetical protein